MQLEDCHCTPTICKRGAKPSGVVKLKTAAMPKILNKGTTCVFVGYPENHGSGTYLMYNPQSKGVHTTHDVVFLRLLYWSKKGPGYKDKCNCGHQ